MKIMISQPMKGKSVDEILNERENIKKELESCGHEIVDSIFTDKEPATSNIALYHLSKSLELMSNIDGVYFMKGWENARGCVIEHLAATKYGLWVMYQN